MKRIWNKLIGKVESKTCPPSHTGLCQIEYDAACKWLKQHRKKCKPKISKGIATNGKYYFRISPSGGLGNGVNVVCEHCGDAKDVTHYDHW